MKLTLKNLKKSLGQKLDLRCCGVVGILEEGRRPAHLGCCSVAVRLEVAEAGTSTFICDQGSRALPSQVHSPLIIGGLYRQESVLVFLKAFSVGTESDVSKCGKNGLQISPMNQGSGRTSSRATEAAYFAARL